MTLRGRLERVERALAGELAQHGPPCPSCGYPRTSEDAFLVLGLDGGPRETQRCGSCERVLGPDGKPLAWPAVVVRGVETETSRAIE